MIELQSLLKEAVDKMASDIFISVGVPPTLKINGQLIKVDDEKLLQDYRQILKNDTIDLPERKISPP